MKNNLEQALKFATANKRMPVEELLVKYAEMLESNKVSCETCIHRNVDEVADKCWECNENYSEWKKR